MVYHRSCVHTILDCEFLFKRNSDFSQGTIDLLFSAYLRKHVALLVRKQDGWLALSPLVTLATMARKYSEGDRKRLLQRQSRKQVQMQILRINQG